MSEPRTADSRSVRRTWRTRPQVFLHIGEPKTGTTFVQRTLWAARDDLIRHGIALPGAGPQGVFRAVQDLRGIAKRADDPAADWDGEWDRLARQALHAPRVSVVSHELLCAADDDQAARAVQSLRGAEVHVVLTVRDIATLLPAEWQESVKHRSTRGWDDWLDDVIDKESPVADRRQYWFWRVHDTAEILRIWSRYVPRSHVHVLTVPRGGADPSDLWRRFAELLGVPAEVVTPVSTRANSSLGVAEVELLRRLNGALSPSVPDWYYMSEVKEPLAHGVLAARSAGGRLELPAERANWAGEHAGRLIDDIRTGGYDVRGTLSDLDPVPPSGAGCHPGEIDDAQRLAAAVAACAGLLERQYRLGRRPVWSPKTAGDLVLGLLARAPGVRNQLYALSERNPVVGAGRGAARRHIERRRDAQRAGGRR